MDHQALEKIEQILARHIGTLEESLGHKLELLAEGQQLMAEHVDRSDRRLVSVENSLHEQSGQIAGIAANLKEHRADTEAHHGVYRVKENL